MGIVGWYLDHSRLNTYRLGLLSRDLCHWSILIGVGYPLGSFLRSIDLFKKMLINTAAAPEPVIAGALSIIRTASIKVPVLTVNGLQFPFKSGVGRLSAAVTG